MTDTDARGDADTLKALAIEVEALEDISTYNSSYAHPISGRALAQIKLLLPVNAEGDA